MKTIAAGIICYLLVAFYFTLLCGYNMQKENSSTRSENEIIVLSALYGIFWPVTAALAAIYWFGWAAMAVVKKISEVKK